MDYRKVLEGMTTQRMRMLIWYYGMRLGRWIGTLLLRRTQGRSAYPVCTFDRTKMNFSKLHRELIEMGYQPNYATFHDVGEIFNMRYLYYKDGVLRQEHIRVFNDELRGHDEIAYEHDFWAHFHAETLCELGDETVAALNGAIDICVI